MQFDFLVFAEVEKSFTAEAESLGGRVFFIEKPSIRVNVYKKKLKNFCLAHKNEWQYVHISEILVQKYIKKYSIKYGNVKHIAVHSHATKFVLPSHGISAIKNAVKMCIKSVRNKILLSGIKKKTDRFFACSVEAGQALFGKKIIKDKRFCVLKNAIDLLLYKFDGEIREKYRKDFALTDKKVIVLIGRLCKEKNQIFFLEVLKTVCRADSSYTLMLIGEGGLRKHIENKITEYNLKENVILTGNRNDIPNLLLCADLMVLPSTMEGLGIVLVEGQASGLPCIGSSCIPHEVKITPYLEFAELEKGAEYWADLILNTPIKRFDAKQYVYESGYDIESNAKLLIDLYSEVL